MAYCYVIDVNGAGRGSTWFALSSPSNHPFDYVCGACSSGQDWSPSPDGHPNQALPYGGEGFTTTHAIFVGSVVGSNIFRAESQCGAGSLPNGFSVFPFYRNGSQVIYDTATTCELTYTADGGFSTGIGTGVDGGGWCGELIDTTGQWDLGIPAPASFSQTWHDDVPIVFFFDFNQNGLNDTLPRSASQIIMDVEAMGGHEPDSPTLCFMDPNVRTIDGVTSARSCQSELMVDATAAAPTNQYRPVTPFRTKENIGDAGTGYGVLWVGGAGAPGVGGEQIYFDLSYRGYVEPERQLVPQISVP